MGSVAIADVLPGIGTTAPRPRKPRPTVRWAITVVATAISAFSLEIIATATGVLLVSSQLLDDASHGAASTIVVATYLLWAAALRTSLTANWRLLEQTGTSTNLPSKLVFDIARRRLRGQRGPRIAASAAYTATEIVKEVPYYAGAFGTAALNDGVDSIDALVFLAGTNVGAAAYELGVARLSNSLLDRRLRRLSQTNDSSEQTMTAGGLVGVGSAEFRAVWSGDRDARASP
jgi:hypothetical protein